MCDKLVVYPLEEWNQQPYMKTIVHYSIERVIRFIHVKI